MIEHPNPSQSVSPWRQLVRGLRAPIDRQSADADVADEVHQGWENIVASILAARDLKIAIRGFIRTPGFTITALLTLALSLGANVAIFAVIDSVLLRPLPFPNADRLIATFNT